MKKALLLIPAALLLFSCARTKRKGVEKDKKETKTAELPDNMKLNNSNYSLGLKSCTEAQLQDLLAIQNNVEIYNATPSQATESAILNACMNYNNRYGFGTEGQCEFIYNDQVVSTLQFSDALWDTVCVQFN